MVTTLKRGASKVNVQEILKALSKAAQLKGVDAYKFCGKIALNKDALAFQKKLRNEWR